MINVVRRYGRISLKFAWKWYFTPSMHNHGQKTSDYHHMDTLRSLFIPNDIFVYGIFREKYLLKDGKG